jgi:DNA repair photolyase
VQPQITPGAPRGRGASTNPPNRFDRFHVEPDGEAGHDDDRRIVPTEYFHDTARSVITSNDSEDIPFSFSLNPYRGCEHGCIYCYARPYHEYLGYSAGLDFETKILVKDDAPDLLRKELGAKRWKAAPMALSGVTDAYQPVERRLGLTRRCLEVLAECRQPVSIVTKSGLVARDVDLLADLAAVNAASVAFTITTLNDDLRRSLEPRASSAVVRLDAVAELARRGVPVGVMVSPVIPGLTDHEIPQILERAAAAGASWADFIMLRLPHGVGTLFDAWLVEHAPRSRARVLARIRTVRNGKLNDPRPHSRMRGEGPMAELAARLFHANREHLGLASHGPALSGESFRRPTLTRRLFEL